uniref:hypothetical protein n=1 Tax=Asaia astilbis TaxID=610244 RepID=UPI001E3C584A|nr:hypothetical protein [Asaia astilbis]
MRSLLHLLCTVVGVVIALLGILLTLGGVYLAWLGGSWAYILLGLMMSGVGAGVLTRRLVALPLAILLSLVAAAWAFGEVGAVFWLIVPRVVVFLVLPIVVGVLVPFFGPEGSKDGIRKSWGMGIAALYAIVFCGLIANMFRPHAEVTADPAQTPKVDTALGQQNGNDWPAWGRNLTGDRFTPTVQINADNVSKLKLAWTYHTGDLAIDGSEYQVTPLKVADTLYLCTPLNKVIAIDPTTGHERWRFDPHLQVTRGNKEWKRCRGVSYADLTTMSLLAPDAKAFGPEDTTAPAPAADQTADTANLPSQGDKIPVAPEPIVAETPCARRIVSTTNDARLFEVDAKTGALCQDFGDHGMVNLLEGLGPTAPGSYYLTSAPLVADGVIMVGGKINDNMTVGEPSGVIRGYDVRTGRLVWAWDASRGNKDSRPLPAGQIYATETPNFWGTASYDPKLGLASSLWATRPRISGPVIVMLIPTNIPMRSLRSIFARGRSTGISVPPTRTCSITT